MKAVRMTIVLVTAFTICQVDNLKKFSEHSIHNIFQIPAAVLYLIAWLNQPLLKSIPHLIVEMLLALWPFYSVIIPLLYHWCMKPTYYSTKLLLNVRLV